LSEDRFNPPYKYAPTDRSGYRTSFNPIRLIVSRARFLDDSDKPYLLFTAFSFPKNLSRFSTDEMLNIEVTFDYVLQYSLIVRDENLDEIQRISTETLASLDHTGVLKIDHTPQQAWYTIAAEAFPRDASEADQNPGSLPGIGQEQLDAIPPLNPDPKKLEISDLVIGVDLPPDFDQSLLPFPIVPSTQIRKVDALKIYFEVYHLKTSDAGQAQFSLEFRVFKLEKDGDKLKREEMTSSAFDFDAPGSTAKESFGISIANLKKGDYDLEVEVKDKNSGKKKRRQARFRVME
jgi:hypothetical protein